MVLPSLKAMAWLTYKRSTAHLQPRSTTMSTPIQAPDKATTAALEAADATAAPADVTRERQKALALVLLQELAALAPDSTQRSVQPGPRALPHQHG
jgi:hypothetical protein